MGEIQWGQSRSVSLGVGVRAGGLTLNSETAAMASLAAETGATSCPELKGAKALRIAQGSGVASVTQSEAWKTPFLLVGFFPELEGNREEEGLVGLREPTRVSKLRESGSTQNLLSQGGLG